MSNHRLWCAAIAVAALGSVASPLSAALIQYENTTGYVWAPDFVVSTTHGSRFLPYMDSTSQPAVGDETASPALKQSFQMPTSSGSGGPRYFQAYGAMQIAQTSAMHFGFPEIRSFVIGDSVGPDSDFGNGAIFGYFSNGFAIDSWFTGLDLVFGVQFTLPDGLHYGWVHVRRSGEVRSPYNAITWAYESTPNTAAVVTIPGASTASIALGAGALAVRRRRR